MHAQKRLTALIFMIIAALSGCTQKSNVSGAVSNLSGNGTSSVPGSGGITTPPPSGGLSISVQGNKLINGSGNAVQLRGVNVSGLEFTGVGQKEPAGQSIPGFDPFGGAEPDYSALATWNVGVLRFPLNEASWLGYSCLNNSTGTTANINPDPGLNYQASVVKYVAAANAAGLYVILDLHWAAPNSASGVPYCPLSQDSMGDVAHTQAFWTSVATTFKNNPAVIFELFNEPWGTNNTNALASWTLLLNGGNFSGFSFNGEGGTNINVTWPAAGMQSLVTAIRNTGATNVILSAGLVYASALNDWLTNEPTDPINQLGASWHIYSNSALTSNSSYAQGILNANIPIIITETGDAFGPGVTTAPVTSAVVGWADPLGVSYLAWTWDVWTTATGSGSYVLITDSSGTPTQGFGTYYKAHLNCRATGSSSCL